MCAANMVDNHCLAGAIYNASWYVFRREFGYKAEWYGKRVILVGRSFAGSQICSAYSEGNTVVKDLSVRDGHARTAEHITTGM